MASYWTDSTARKGLYVSSDSTQTASIYLNGAKYYATGTNCYELLLVSLHKKRDAQGRIDLSDSFAALDVLRRNGVGIVRFNCGVYFASELTAYTQNREEYSLGSRPVGGLCREVGDRLDSELFLGFIRPFRIT